MAGSLDRFMRRQFWALFGGIWLLVGLPFLLIGVFMWREAGRFERGAERIDATVESLDIVRGNRDRGASHRVRYRFTLPDGRQFEGRDDVDAGFWATLAEARPVSVEYLPDDPATNRIAGQTDPIGKWLFLSLGGFFSFAGAGLLVWSLLRESHRRRLAGKGFPAEAVVLSCEPTSVRFNRVQQWRVRYRYRDQFGGEHEGKSPYLPPGEAQAWKAGDTVSVRYDPQKPEDSVWMES